jgi:hypothetical protein
MNLPSSRFSPPPGYLTEREIRARAFLHDRLYETDCVAGTTLLTISAAGFPSKPYWFHAYAPVEMRYGTPSGMWQHGTRTGKWLVFVPAPSFDDAWSKIQEATERGALGPASKGSTDRPSPFSTPGQRVVCVYTYDHADTNDVERVRTQLRQLGFERPLSYKADSTTRAGVYSSPGHSVSLYRS